MFGAFDFSQLNETLVREFIVARLLRKLGYHPGSTNDVRTEVIVNYKLSLGREKRSDRKVGGKVDYLMRVDVKWQWIIEATAGYLELEPKDELQAWRYANHPAIRACVYVLTNGRTLKVFQTNRGPSPTPILDLTYEELEEKFYQLSNILSPEGLRTWFPEVKLDLGKPLAVGLKSYAKIIGGQIEYQEASLPEMVGLRVGIAYGTVDRIEGGGIPVYLVPQFPHSNMDPFAKAINARDLELFTSDDQLSTDAERPTILRAEKDLNIPEGTEIPNFKSVRSADIALADIEANMAVEVRGYYIPSEKAFRGIIKPSASQNGVELPIGLLGKIVARLA